jgi:hypothetical protein
MHHALIGRPYYVLVLVFCFSRHEIEIKSLSICLSVIIVAFYETLTHYQICGWQERLFFIE